MRPLATKLSNDTRTLMNSDWYKLLFPATKIDKDTEDMITTTQNGHRIVATVLGKNPVGLGCNYAILDDANKPDEALSPTIRPKVNEWVEQNAMSRFNDRLTGRLVDVQQRVHEEDVTGFLLEKGGYVHLKLPVIADKKYTYIVNNRKFTLDEGEYLHEERFPQSVLDELRTDLGDYAYAGQYMQSPIPIGGGIFKKTWIKYYDSAKQNMSSNVVILCDPAGISDSQTSNKRKKSDWTVFWVVALAPDNNYYVVDIVRDKFNPTERINALFDLHRKWNGYFGKPPKVGYEAYGLQSDIHYLNQKQEDENYRFPIIELGGQMSKVGRIMRLIPDMQNGRWYFPKKLMYTNNQGQELDLVKEFLEGELAVFPVAKNDDAMDALSRIYEKELMLKFPRLTKPNLVSTDEIGQEESNSWIGW